MSNARFSILQSKAVSDSQLSDSQFRTLAALGTFGDKNGYCFPSLKTLSALLNKSKPAISRDIKILVQLGYIEITRQHRPDGGYKNNLYRLIFDTKELDPINDTLIPINTDGNTLLTSEVNSLLTPEVNTLTTHINDPINDNKDKNINDNNGIKTAIPEKLNVPEFLDAWRNWEQYRKEIKKKLTPRTIELQLKKLAQYTPEEAAQMIVQSIENGWQGLFPLRGDKADTIKINPMTGRQYHGN